LSTMTRRLLIFISLIAAAQALVTALYRPLIPQYGAVIGLSPAAIGLVMSAFAFLPLFFAVPAGVLIDRWGPRPLIVLGYLSLCSMVSYSGGPQCRWP